MMACVLAKTGLKRTIAILNKSNYNLLQDQQILMTWLILTTTVSRIMERSSRHYRYCLFIIGEYEFIEAKILEKSELLNKSIETRIYLKI